MYCPNCGSNNQAEIKFCTRCGTNLNIVSDALSGKPATPPQFDERMVKLLTDYYSSRRSTLVGALTLPVGLLLLTAMFIIGFPEHLIIVALIGLGLSIYGAIALFWGIEHWISSTSEMKALNTVIPSQSLPPASKDTFNTSNIPSIPVLVERYSTDPIQPGSVTEQTTRQLERSRRHQENQSKQNQ
jgi:zinc-ribbon domain